MSIVAVLTLSFCSVAIGQTNSSGADREAAALSRIAGARTEQGAFQPTPETAHLCLATEKWLLWQTSADVSRGGMHGRTFAYHYFLQADPQSPARPVFDYESGLRPEPVGILTNGTVVSTFIGASTDLVLVDHQGKRVRVSCQESQLSIAEDDRPLAAYDDGVLVRANISNKREPVYFVPWKTPPHDLTRPVALDFSGKVMVTDSEGVDYPFDHDVFRREGNTIVWAWEDSESGHLSFFDLTDRTRKIHPNSPEAIPCTRGVTTLQATDGETAVLMVNNEERGDCVTGFDIRTGKRLPVWLGYGRVVAVRHRIAYVLTSDYKGGKTPEWPYALQACDLTSAEPKPRVLLESGYGEPSLFGNREPSPLTTIVREDALTVWWNHQWRRIEWQIPTR